MMIQLQNFSLTRRELEKDSAEEAKIYELDHYLRDRTLKDPDNQRMLNELGRHFDQGNLTMFLEDPEVEPTNNIAERMLRPAIVARKVSQCSKTERDRVEAAGLRLPPLPHHRTCGTASGDWIHLVLTLEV